MVQQPPTKGSARDYDRERDQQCGDDIHGGFLSTAQEVSSVWYQCGAAAPCPSRELREN